MLAMILNKYLNYRYRKYNLNTGKLLLISIVAKPISQLLQCFHEISLDNPLNLIAPWDKAKFSKVWQSLAYIVYGRSAIVKTDDDSTITIGNYVN